MSPRKVDELPWQLTKAKAWDRLYSHLSDLSFFAALWDVMILYWHEVSACYFSPQFPRHLGLSPFHLC